MYVPNFIPEPLEVPGNVTILPWRARVGFVRRVIFAHLVVLLTIGGLSRLPMPSVHPGWAWAAAGASLVVLDAIRVMRRGRRDEANLSLAFFPIAIVAIAVAVGLSDAAHWPFWAAPVGPAMLLVYAGVARWDFSFVGGILLALIGTLVTVSAVCLTVDSARGQAAWAITISLSYLVYFIYDLASLQSRRRPNEIGGAVVDLHRDVLNFVSYVPRVVFHWKRHRIWSA
ncbi:hypothetical protein BH11ARM2_BH11ARM2_20420 [soil metagenome]